MKAFILSAVIFGTAVFCTQESCAQANIVTKPELTWLEIDWQPAWINDGPLAGQGYAQTVARLLREQLTDYHHVSRSVTNVRIYSVLQSRDSCFPASPYQGQDLHDGMKEGVIWSAPAYLYFYQGLITSPASLAQIKEHDLDGYINFTTLIADNSMKGAFQPGRSYSRWLNPILTDDSKTGNLFKWSGETQLTQSMFKLLEAKRIDYFIEYVIMLKFHQEVSGSRSEYLYLPIQEHKDIYGLGAIACSDTPLGRKAIKDINKYLLKVRQTPELMDINRKWLMPEGQEKIYWQAWEREVLSRLE